MTLAKRGGSARGAAHRVAGIFGESGNLGELDELALVKDLGDAGQQPIFLTDQPGNPNQAQLLLLCDGASRADLEAFDLVCELFDGNDEAIVAAARSRWRDYKAAGHTLVYFQQNDAGRWEEKARA